jgi:Uma2 family endonuclease
LAESFPRQGDWTEAAFLSLPTKRPVELVDGTLEFLPMPTLSHQMLVFLFARWLSEFVEQRHLGIVNVAPCPIRLWAGRLREPDVFFVTRQRIVSSDEPPNGADLVAEVLSPGKENRDRDLIEKAADYAKAGVAEYWIIDPENNTVQVRILEAGSYRVTGPFTRGQSAASVRLPGFTVDVAALFAAAEIHPQ